jgi:hypothetical protein
MARPTPELISALRTTAARLREGSSFAWGHMGSCICGHLAQTITELSPAEIHARAMERHGDWSQQSVEHCPASGLAIDHVIDEMLSLGMIPSDIRHLERLSDPKVLARVPSKYLRRQEQANAVQYMEAWAELLEDQLEAAGAAAPAPPIESNDGAAAAMPLTPEGSPLQVTP